MNDDAWQEQAACAKIGGDFWFPEAGDSATPGKNICKLRCPVRDACLQSALDNAEMFGTWGGMTPTERTRHVYPHGTLTHYRRQACRCVHCRGAAARSKTNSRERKARWRDKLEEEAG